MIDNLCKSVPVQVQLGNSTKGNYEMSTTETPTAKGVFTNVCECEEWNEETSEYVPRNCYGECWEDTLYGFGIAVEHLLKDNSWFVVENLRLWDGNHSGEFRANTVAELVTGMTVNSEWAMAYEVFSDRIEYSLSHHDAPTGSNSVLRPFVEADE